jgi:type III restriction enzyme
VRDKVSWDGKLNTLTISTPLTEDEAEVLKASVTSETAAAAIVEAAEVSRTTAIEFFQTPAELGERFRVPQLALRVQGELQLFDDPEVLEYPWDLSPYDAAPTADDLSLIGCGLKVSEGGEIDVDARAARWFRASCPICSAIWAWSISPRTGMRCALPPGCAATCPSRR